MIFCGWVSGFSSLPLKGFGVLLAVHLLLSQLNPFETCCLALLGRLRNTVYSEADSSLLLRHSFSGAPTACPAAQKVFSHCPVRIQYPLALRELQSLELPGLAGLHFIHVMLSFQQGTEVGTSDFWELPLHTPFSSVRCPMTSSRLRLPKIWLSPQLSSATTLCLDSTPLCTAMWETPPSRKPVITVLTALVFPLTGITILCCL